MNNMATTITYTYSVNSTENLRIEPVMDGESTNVSQYKVVDSNGNSLFYGDLDGCNIYLRALDTE